MGSLYPLTVLSLTLQTYIGTSLMGSINASRVLNSIFHHLDVQQIQVAKGKNKRQRNSLFYEFYQRKLAEGKTKKQALICVM